MTVEEYAKHILESHGCDEYTYGDEKVETILEDLKTEYPNGMEYPYVEVANAIKMMSKPKLIERKPFLLVIDTDSCCDGCECDTFEQAKEGAFDNYYWWMCEVATWKDKDNPTDEEKEDWNYMIYNTSAWVKKYNPDTDEYEDYWNPSDEELEEIGWCLWEEHKKKENSIDR